MPTDPYKLRHFLDSDPVTYDPLATDEDIASIGNAQTESHYVPLPSTELLAWAASNNRLGNIKNAADLGVEPIKSIAQAAYLMITRDSTILDLNLSDRMAMLDALVTAGVLAASDKTSILTLATRTRSKFQVAGFPKKIWPAEIQRARSLVI